MADPGPDADLDQPVDHLVEEADGARLEERRRARAQHLDRRELPGDPLLLGVEHRVQRAQPLEHVLDERRVVGDVPPRQRFAGDVDVGVDQPGRDDEPVTADAPRRFVPGLELGGLADRHDLVAPHGDGAVADDVAIRVHRHHVPTGDEQIDGFTFHGDLRRLPRRPG